MRNTKRTRVSDILERLLSRKKLIGARRKHTALPVSYPELLLVAPREGQSINPIMSEKDEREVAEAGSGS